MARSLSFFVLIFLLPSVLSTGQLSILGVSFTSDGRLSDGSCCDMVAPLPCSWDPCDTFFVFCADKKNGIVNKFDSCQYKRVQTGNYIKTIEIKSFGKSFAGNIANPIQQKITIPWEGSMMLKVQVNDWDPSKVDHIDDMSHIFTQKPAKNESAATAQTTTMAGKTRGKAKLTVSFKVWCDPHYYGDDCATYCVPKDDATGHYKCGVKGEKICLPGWYSDDNNRNCVYEDLCAKKQCSNTVKCNNIPPDDFFCACKPGYKGRYCNKIVDNCASKPCKNSGVCTNMINDYSCRCQPGYTGKSCQQEIDMCAAAPCNNGGTCINFRTYFTCTCPSTHVGAICNQTNHCYNPAACGKDPKCSPCHNNGVCVNGKNDYDCTCVGRFYGKNCEKEFTTVETTIAGDGPIVLNGKITHSQIDLCKRVFEEMFLESYGNEISIKVEIGYEHYLSSNRTIVSMLEVVVYLNNVKLDNAAVNNVLFAKGIKHVEKNLPFKLYFGGFSALQQVKAGGAAVIGGSVGGAILLLLLILIAGVLLYAKKFRRKRSYDVLEGKIQK